MRRLRTIGYLLSLALFGLGSASCKPRASLADDEREGERKDTGAGLPGSEDADPAVELERLRLSNQETLHTIQIQSLANDKRLLEISNELGRLSLQLASDSLSEADRTKLTSQQTTLQTERSQLEATQKELKGRIQSVKERVDNIDARIIALAEELEATDPKEAKSFWSEIQALKKEILELKSQQTNPATNPIPTVSTPPTPTPSGPVVSLPKGTLTAEAYHFYYEEVGVKKDCLDIAAGATQQGATVVAYPCTTGRRSQAFKLENFADLSFRLIAQHSNQCLYVTGGSKAINSTLEQHNCSDPAQVVNAMIFKYREIDSEKGTFKLQNVNSNLCLKINTDGKIIQGDCNINFTLLESSRLTP